jgi:DNA-directed RNA polymerase specialized sigma24 family protein
MIEGIDGIEERGVTLSLVRRYAQRHGDLEYQELLNIAALAAFQAERNWKPDGKASRSTYVWRAVNMALYQQIVWMRSPVHGAWYTLGKLRDLRSVEYSEFTSVSSDGYVSVESRVDKARTYRKIYDHILSRPAGRAAMDVIIGGKTIAEASSATGASVKEIKRATREARQAIRSDEEIEAYARTMS